MQFVRAMLVAVAVLFAGAQPAQAQQDQRTYEATMRWAGRQQQIIQSIVMPLQHMPQPWTEDTPAARAAWMPGATEWVASYRVQLQAARAEIERLGPVPDDSPYADPYRRQHAAVPTLVSGIEGFLNQFESGIEAVRRNDPTAITIAAINTVDAQILIMTQFRNINGLQAEMIDDGPQRYLLRSFASSYEALIAVLGERRAGYLGQTIRPSAVDAVRAAAAAMLRHSRDGRAAAVQVEGELPAQVPPEQSDFLRRIRLAYQSFGGSFDREEVIAGHLDAMADIMARNSNFENAEADIAPHALAAGRLDLERGSDIQRRTAMLQQVVPPT